MKKLISACFVILMLSACGNDVKTESAGKPLSDRDERRESRGKLTGEGGFNLFGGDKETSTGGVIGVNSYLWRATLDTVSFMPLVSADPFGGTIITDWYEDSKTPGERFKVNALILDKTLRSDGVKIQVFKQKLTKGNWRDAAVDDKLARALEDTILTRARELKVATKK